MVPSPGSTAAAVQSATKDDVIGHRRITWCRHHFKVGLIELRCRTRFDTFLAGLLGKLRQGSHAVGIEMFTHLITRPIFARRLVPADQSWPGGPSTTLRPGPHAVSSAWYRFFPWRP